MRILFPTFHPPVLLPLFLISVFVYGCSTPTTETKNPPNAIEKTEDIRVKQNKAIEELKGREGFLLAPVIFRTKVNGTTAEPDQFHRCEKIKILNITHSYTDHEYTVTIQQGAHRFEIIGNEGSGEHPELWNISHFLAPQLVDFIPARITTTAGPQLTKDLACNGHFWKGMPRAALSFVMGPPTSVRHETRNGKSSEQWDYRVPSPGKTSTFWLEDGQLRKLGVLMENGPKTSDASGIWRKCNACKKPIALGAKYYVCSVSTCNQARTGLTFCSVFCFETHLPEARHRTAAAVEKFAPTQLEPPNETEGTSGARRIVVRSNLVGPPGTSSAVPREVLIIASRLKEYVQARSEFNTSASVMEFLSDHLRVITDRAIDNARSEGRKTVLDRDFDFLKRS